jgi:predicted transcriptional regulator
MTRRRRDLLRIASEDVPGDQGDLVDQTLATNLRRARDALGLSTSEIVARAGVSEECGARLESRPGDLTLRELRQIAAALDTTESDLTDGVT